MRPYRRVITFSPYLTNATLSYSDFIHRWSDGWRSAHELPPLPRSRPRSLSFTQGPRHAPQLQSRLLQLPAELRAAIHRELVNESTEIHIGNYGGEICSAVCRNQKYSSGDYIDGHAELECINVNEGPGNTCFVTNIGLDFFGYIRSCRKVYVEMIQLLYTQPVFIFDDWVSLLMFSAAILPKRLQSIRSIRIIWYDDLDISPEDPAFTWPQRATYRYLWFWKRVVRNPNLPSVLERLHHVPNQAQISQSWKIDI